MAAGNNYYLITSLSALESLTSAPPLSNSALLEHIADRPGAEELVKTLLLADDLMQRQALLAGEIEQADPTILTAEQAADEEPLPEYLAGPPEPAPRRITGDSLWAAYFRHAMEVARARGCGFLEDWIGFEVAMRNALAEARAKALGLDPNDYFVEPRLGSPVNFSSTIGEWSAAPDPLTGLKALDRARWDWLTRNDRSYSFEDDEIAAYAAKLMLLHRWRRLAQTAENRQD
ncbi:MAG: DUF2764 family protein [Phycisphaerae bacterium]|nr:DUF2764 family protein [Phycisphaerae bacterium]